MSGSTHDRLFFDGETYFASLLHGLAHARSTIELEAYIFEDDRIGRRVLTALREAAARGVRVRVLVDGFGCWRSQAALEKSLGTSAVAFRVYHPLPALGELLLPDRFAVANRRNHRKVCVVDGASAWVGSFNISDVHLASASHARGWRDTALALHGDEAAELAAAFEQAWSETGQTHRHRRRAGGPRVLLNSNPRLRARRNHEIVRLIDGARSRVWITTPYFSPNRGLRRALRHAARRGVDVRVLLPDHPDVPGMSWINEALARWVARSGVQFYFYRASVLHAKSIQIDDSWALVGSSNFNHRSLFHDLEVDVVLTDPGLITRLARQFLDDLGHARTGQGFGKGQTSLATRVLDQVARSLRRLT